MLEKVLFWRVNSTTLTSDLNSVNNVFIKLITKASFSCLGEKPTTNYQTPDRERQVIRDRS